MTLSHNFLLKFKTSLIVTALYNIMSPALAEQVIVKAQGEGVTQHSTTSDKKADLTDKDLEIIEVTAQKRVENIQDVPISITAFNIERMEKLGLRRLDEVSEFIPNFTMTKGNDFSSLINIRGVGAASQNIGFDARVGLYLDGVYLGQSPAHNQELLDLAHIEVLRGPQGTLFGKNSIAGSVNLISQKPTEELTGSVSASVGNYDYKSVNTLVNIPLSEQVFTKFSYSKQKRDGFVENIVTGNDINEVDNYAYRGQIRYLVADKLDVNFSFDQLRAERNSYDGDPITDTLGNNLNTEAPEKDKVSLGFDPREDRDVSGQILTAEWEIESGHLLKSISGHRDTRVTYTNDFDFSVEDVSALYYKDDYNQWSQEFQVISPEDKFEYVAGLFLYHLDADTERVSNVGDETLSLFTGIPRSTVEYLAEYGTEEQMLFANGLLYAFNPGQLSTKGDVETQSYSAFFNSTYHIAPQLELAMGLRYSRETKKVDWTISSIDPSTQAPVIPAFQLANGNVNDERTDNFLSPLVSLSYRFNDHLNSYVKYSTAYKSGGYNVDFLTQAQFDAGIEYDKETVDSYEMGVKGDLFDNRLRFSSAVFFSKYKDYQVNQLIDLGSGTTAISIRNAAEVETKGAEFEATYQVTDHFQVLSSIGLLDAEFTKYPGGGDNGEDLSHTDLTGASDFSGHLGMQYTYPVPQFSSDLYFSINYNYESGYNSTLNNEKSITLDDGSILKLGEVDGYGIVNANISLESYEAKGFDVYLWGRNLFDDDTAIVNGEKSFFGTRRNMYVNPRTYGVTLKYHF